MNNFNLTLQEGFDSKHLFEKINILEANAVNSFTEGLDWIKNNNINCVLVGGTAVVHYLSKGRDLTPDMDFLVTNIDDLKRKLNDSDFSFSDLIDISGKNIGITVEQFNIDFLKTVNGKKSISDLILKTSLNANVGGNQVKIIAPELLTVVKFDLGRDKDLSDAFNLLKSGKIDKKKYLIFANGLQKVLNDPESIISYAEMI